MIDQGYRMSRKSSFIAIYVIICALASQISFAQSNGGSSIAYSEDPQLTQAIELVMSGELSKALKAAESSNNVEYTQSVIEVLRIYNNPTAIPLSSAAAFLEQYQWVPQEVFLPKIERSINHETNPKDVVEWFAFKTPKLNRGKFFELHAKIVLNQVGLNNIQTKNYFRLLWRITEFDIPAEEYIIQRYKNIFTVSDLLEKIDFLIWSGSYGFASKLIALLPNEYHTNLKTKVDIARSPTLAAKFINKPLGKNDELIKYLYTKELIRDKNYVAAYKSLLTIHPKKFHDKWWKLKNVVFRELLSERKFLLAYNITQNHGMIEGSDFADAEWLAGWVALEFFNKPAKAVKHFTHMFNKTKLANSKSKAAYWLARAYQKSKNEVESKKWFNQASIYSSTFYGQLAIAKIKGGAKYNYFDSYKNHGNIIPIEPNGDNKIAQVTLLAYHLYQAGQKMLAYDVINYIPTLKLDRPYIEQCAQFFVSKSLRPLAVEIGKASANKSFILIKESYPIDITMPPTRLLPKALYLAIIRQESNFDPIAVSPAGARGLMQLMPDTAAKLAKTLGLDANAYINNPAANVQKGSAYVDQLYSQYESLILTIAAYNAGPGNVRKWVNTIGDPRKMTTLNEKINWIESIPFAETRNYVKKVIENMVLYDNILNKNHTSQTIVEFLEL